MKERLRRFDKGLARGEAALATLVLLSLIGVAAMQATLRNLADNEVLWATEALHSLGWADSFMEKTTLWLAMLGASLATHYDKHIGIDVLSRVVKPKARALMRGIVNLFASITSFYFARVVLGALMAKAGRIPGEYAVFNDDFDTIHICVGTAEQLTAAGAERPDIFCALRGFFDGLGMTVNSPERMMDLMVPAMFCIIAARLFASGVHALMRIPTGGIPAHEVGGANHEGKDAASVSGVPVDEDHDPLGNRSDDNDTDDDDSDDNDTDDDDSDDNDSDDNDSDDNDSDDNDTDDNDSDDNDTDDEEANS